MSNSDEPEVLSVYVVSQTFRARASSYPDMVDFVRRSLGDAEMDRDVHQVVTDALLDAASGLDGQVTIGVRFTPEFVDVEVLRPAPVSADGESLTPSELTSMLAPVVTEEDASFATWLSETLQRQQMSQEAAARQLGVSVRSIGRWVSGASEPRPRDLERIRSQLQSS